MKKAIKVIFTGGTIGSAARDGKVDLDGNANRRLLEMYRAERGEDVTFDCDEPVSMLSENVHEEQLHAIYAAVKAVDPKVYDGVIVTHGTDSLCINAHYFSLTLCNLGLPIVLVSSLYPLEDRRQNGLKNFIAAVDFVEKGGARGVFVAFANGNSPAEIHLAGRLMFCDQITGWYRSVLGESLATVEGGEVIYRESPSLPTREELALAGQYPFVYAALGIHPESIIEEDTSTRLVFGGDWRAELRAIRPLYEHPKAVAVGECGLDYHWPIPKEEQQALFEEEIRCALELEKPILVHDREAHADVYALLKKYKPKGVLHCYSGSAEDAVWLARQGMYIGFGGTLTFKNARKTREAAAALPMEAIVLETDCPYMAPEPHRGQRNDSSLIIHVAEVLGQIKGLPVQEVLRATNENAKRLFGI